MAGHSKWATTKRHKAAIDAKRGKIFSVLSKELMLAARAGGGSPEFNARLRTVLLKAKAANMPADNIERAIKKGTGELEGFTLEELTYEGYGPGGIALIVEVTTDNKNRGASEVRSTFTKHGGNLAAPGALAFTFSRHGQFLVPADQASEEQLMELVLDAGAEDILTDEEGFEVRCAPNDYDSVADALDQAGIKPASSEIAWIPKTLVPADLDLARKALKLVDALEDWDDVNHVYHNLELTDEIRAQLEGE
jgi:YebC/PmpR family DNA-binding regulatory protein